MIPNTDIAGLVLHFRTPAQTLGCLKSLHDEGILRAIVVDNSQDNGRSLAAMSLGLNNLRTRGMTVELLQPTRNLGFASGVNLGLAHIGVHGQWHALLINSDAVLMPGSASALKASLSDAEVAVSFVRNPLGVELCALIGYYQRHFALYLQRTAIGVIKYPSGCCLLIRKDQVRDGFFDTEFFFYGEDVMLGRSLQRRGLAAVECDGAAVVHAGSLSAKNGSLFYEYHMVRAHWLLARKLAGNRAEMALFVILRCITLPARATLRSARWRSLRPWRGFVMATKDALFGRCRDLTPPAVQDAATSADR